MEELWGVFREGVSLKVSFKIWKPIHQVGILPAPAPPRPPPCVSPLYL